MLPLLSLTTPGARRASAYPRGVDVAFRERRQVEEKEKAKDRERTLSMQISPCRPDTAPSVSAPCVPSPLRHPDIPLSPGVAKLRIYFGAGFCKSKGLGMRKACCAVLFRELAVIDALYARPYRYLCKSYFLLPLSFLLFTVSASISPSSTFAGNPHLPFN